jgi:hypothetical protein
MDLLDIPLPVLRLRIGVHASVFFDRCEDIARACGWTADRRRQYGGPGYDQLNLNFGAGARGYPMIRMTVRPSSPDRLYLDIVADWKTSPPEYDEYLEVARTSYRTLLAEYKQAHGNRYRLGIPRRPVDVDLDSLDCARIGYAAEKLGGLCHSLAVGAGDARERLINAHWSFHVIRPEDLPEPLRGHLAWVYSEITRRPTRHRMEGSVEATVRTMKTATAARILERLVDLGAAVDRLYEHCQNT